MKVDYKKFVLDDDFMKVEVGNDCTVIGDCTNMEKLCEYFDGLNKAVDAMTLNPKVMSVIMHHMDQIQKALRNTAIAQEVPKNNETDVKSIINQHINQTPQTLSCLTPDEFCAILLKHGDVTVRKMIKDIPKIGNYKKINDLFKNYFFNS